MKEYGFTLIELSIVLVIIGLIVGGVLVGQDLIKAAEIRGTISQIEKFNTAATTFKLKYGGIPGDIQPAAAASLGFFQLPTTCFGSGGSDITYDSGLINNSQSGGSDVGYTTTCDKRYVFWRHLSEAKLIDGQYGMDPTDPLTATGIPTSESNNEGEFPTGDTTNQALFLPTAKRKEFGFWQVGQGYQWKSASNYIEYQWNQFNTTGGDLTPSTAYAMDSKIDDGKPNTGTMIERGSYWFATARNNKCTFGGADEYDASAQYILTRPTTPASGYPRNCDIAIKTGF